MGANARGFPFLLTVGGHADLTLGGLDVVAAPSAPCSLADTPGAARSLARPSSGVPTRGAFARHGP